jgi:hypothetical protein
VSRFGYAYRDKVSDSLSFHVQAQSLCKRQGLVFVPRWRGRRSRGWKNAPIYIASKYIIQNLKINLLPKVSMAA